MKKESINVNANANEETTAEAKQVVLIANGAGTEPIEVQWTEGMTVAAALEAAEIELNKGETAVIGESLVENPEETPVEPGQMVVIDSMPSNG